ARRTFARSTWREAQCPHAARAGEEGLQRERSIGKTNPAGTDSLSRPHQDFDSKPQSIEYPRESAWSPRLDRTHAPEERARVWLEAARPVRRFHPETACR